MSDPISFLHQKADEIRAFASMAPEMTRELRELAGFIEEAADDMSERLYEDRAHG